MFCVKRHFSCNFRGFFSPFSPKTSFFKILLVVMVFFLRLRLMFLLLIIIFSPFLPSSSLFPLFSANPFQTILPLCLFSIVCLVFFWLYFFVVVWKTKRSYELQHNVLAPYLFLFVLFLCFFKKRERKKTCSPPKKNTVLLVFPVYPLASP